MGLETVQFLGRTSDGPSYSLWADCPLSELRDNKNKGYGFYEDFVVGGLITVPTTTAALIGKSLSGFSVATAVMSYQDVAGGGLTIGSDGTDNDAVSIFSLSHCFQMGLTRQPLWFECSVVLDSLLTTETGFFVGLCDSTAKATTVPLTDSASAIAAVNVVGFHALDTDIGVVKSVYKANDVTAVSVNTSAAARLVENTYVKLGFKMALGGLVSWYIDGVKQANTFQCINDLGTGFPGDVTMAPIIAMAVGAATGAQTMGIRWLSCYQLRA